MPNLDLPPGDYRERKPKGWRWKLPWSHPDDTKLPMVMFFVALGFLVYFFLNMPSEEVGWLAGGVAVFAFGAGGMIVLWLRD